MRISGWSSDVCSSDLIVGVEALCRLKSDTGEIVPAAEFTDAMADAHAAFGITERMLARIVADIKSWHGMGLDFGHVGINVPSPDRKSVVEGKSVSVRVDLGGRRIIKKKKKKRQ